MHRCEGTTPIGTRIRDRRTLLHSLAVGDIFHAHAPNGASLICLTTAVTDTTVQARTVTHAMHLDFDRETGVAEWIGSKDWPDKGYGDDPVRCVVDSVEPLPVDIHNILLFVDRKSRLTGVWKDMRLSDDEKRAFLYVYSHYPANPIDDGDTGYRVPAVDVSLVDKILAPFRIPVD